MKFVVPLIFLSLLVSIASSCKAPEVRQKDWWETGQFYQIYPRSFMDSNGDGIGDLNGITARLDYLTKLGITATWLSPIFTSPMADFGYDISNFVDIQPEYGTLADFDNLIKRAKELGIKIILDFVPNHSSDEHEWFVKSENRVAGYEDFYIWDDGKVDPTNSSNRLPPSNWISVFRGSAWKWSDKRKQFYYHAFVEKQPDLNYRNPLVVQAMKDVLTFWLDRGVAGFRCDAVPNVFEKAPVNGVYLDEPVNLAEDDPDNFDHLKHIYVAEQPETIDMVYQWRAVLDEHQRVHGGDSRILMIETYADPNYTIQFYGNSTTKGAQLPFNFNLIVRAGVNTNAEGFVAAIDAWMKYMPSSRTANWVIGNHDQKRASTRYGIKRIDFMNMLVMMLPGASVSYQGEELGMLDADITWEETVDPAACNSNPDIFQAFSRDPARTPFQWDDSKNAGFSTGDTTWLPVTDSYKTYNVAVENATSTQNTHIKTYQDLIKLRTKKTLQYGSYNYGYSDNIFVLKRWSYGEEYYVMLANLDDHTNNFNLARFYADSPNSLTVVARNVESSRAVGSIINSDSIQLAANEAIVAVASLKRNVAKATYWN